tara:strand:- start:2036 stop:2974 length:939 start_codon:yes stop_codon:yes gene_type:complete
MYLDINTSRARKTFKRLLGQANHYLITILIGLDYIKQYDVSLPDDFKTSWNPKDKTSSSIRSREFAIKATLSLAIDSLDAYLGLCHRKPSLYQNKELYENAGGAGQSVDKKFIVLSEYIDWTTIPNFDKYFALTNLALKWRNRLIHFFAENDINEDVRNVLKNNKDFFFDNFQGLDIDRLLDNFDNSKTPSFKEITSIIRSIHKCVQLADEYLLNNINKETHFIECLDFHFKLNTLKESDLKSKTALLYNLTEKRRLNSINQTVMNYGFSEVKKPTTKIKKESISTLVNFNLEKVLSFLNENDFNKKGEMIL